MLVNCMGIFLEFVRNYSWNLVSWKALLGTGSARRTGVGEVVCSFKKLYEYGVWIPMICICRAPLVCLTVFISTQVSNRLLGGRLLEVLHKSSRGLRTG